MPRPERLLKIREQRRRLDVSQNTLSFKLSEQEQNLIRMFGRRTVKKELILSWLNGDLVKKQIVTKILLSYNPKELLSMFNKEELIQLFCKVNDYDLNIMILRTIFLHKDRREILANIRSKQINDNLYINNFVMEIIKQYLRTGVVPNFEAKHGWSDIDKQRPDNTNPEYLVLGEKLRRVVDLKDYNEKTRKLTEISNILSKEFGFEFIGIMIVGSLYKGYSAPQSDVDYVLLSRNPLVLKRFKELSKTKEYELKLCNTGTDLNPNIFDSELDVRHLFRGLFFGNKKQLLDAQRNAFIKLDKSTWNVICNFELEQDLQLEKAFIRGNLGSRERRRILARVAMNALPDYETMKKQLGL